MTKKLPADSKLISTGNYKPKSTLFALLGFLPAAGHLGAGNIPLLVDKVQIALYSFDADFCYFFCHV